MSSRCQDFVTSAGYFAEGMTDQHWTMVLTLSRMWKKGTRILLCHEW